MGSSPVLGATQVAGGGYPPARLSERHARGGAAGPRRPRSGPPPPSGPPHAALERALEVLDADELAGCVDRYADRVEAEEIGVGAVGSFDEPASGHLPHTLALWAAQALERAPAGGQADRFDLAECERCAVVGDDVELSPAGAVITFDDLESEAGQMLGGEALAVLAESVAEVGAHCLKTLRRAA